MIQTAACIVSDQLARLAGSVWAVYVAIAVCVAAWFAYPPTDPFNSVVSDVSLVMLFVLQRSSDRDTRAIKNGTAEIARAVPGADGGVMLG